MDFTTSALILAWAAILVLALAMAGMLRQLHALKGGDSRVDHLGPSIGAAAPALPLPDAVRRNVPVVALFLDLECDSCERTLQVAEELVNEGENRVEFVGLFADDPNDHRSHGVRLVGNATEAFESYQIPVTPFGVVISTEGTVLASTALGAPHEIRDLVSQLFGERSAA
ncbi:hypothetical protein SMC26_40770 [Actinomadura fulvescens]|uniref:Thioredoxin domain-containing protein n=1 Tax=Actinomadura fulvescens TaxID=46160 RepID=A0ABP6D9D1_9ACTN